ncbi:photosystem reaction center subunit H [Brevibacillus sp. SYP-B805]|uniref:PRC-barrel domain-containing protein n=1 Tax=Brevibacillus sp. SYP-B805 TaxID=1578199 RepID=UPI0013EE3453|nr:PRC-barrel domain-containing protein [Brevibacillus sp. SYP-B805]NGQ94239.1 photosystem reaction center subunit H [Brevibacillus sp. SYP-B805]
MRKASDVIGLPVLSLQSGDEIGRVRDILCDLEWSVLGVVLKEAGWFQEGAYIPLDKICSVGTDCLTVADDRAVTSLHELADSDTVGFLTGKGTLKGKSVYTTSGEHVGKVEDVYFSPNWERLVAYEVSNGWIADVKEGRRRLPAPLSVTIGEENLIVPDSNRFQA